MRIVIGGAGQVGSYLAKMLSREANEITVIDADAERLSQLSATADVVTVQGLPSSIKVLKSAGVAGADLFIAVNPYVEQDVNITSALLAKKLGAKKVTARIIDEEYLAPENKMLFKEMGIDLMFYPEKIAAGEIVSSLLNSANSDTMEFAGGKLQIEMFRVDENSSFVDMKMSDFIQSMPAEDAASFRIIAIVRDGETVIPSSETVFRYSDQVYTISTKEGLETVRAHFGVVYRAINHVMVVGGNATGEMVARGLSQGLSDVKIIEKDKNRCLELSENLPGNVMVVNGDGRNSDFLYEESIRDYDAFVALTGSDETNVLTCVIAKKFGVPHTIAEVENIEYIRLAEEMGVDTVINRKLITASRIFKFTLSGKARFVKYMAGTDAEIIEYTVAPGSAITKAALKDITFPKNAIIGGVIRGKEAFIAVGSTKIEPYDRVAIFAMPQTLREIDKLFK